MDTQQNVFSISEAKIAVVTANNSTDYTTSTPMDVPELSTMEVTVASETKEAKFGPGYTADSFTMKTGYDVKFESVNIPLDVIAAINGAKKTVATSTITIEDSLTDIPALFNLAFKTDFVNGDPADFHMEIFAVKGLIDVVTKADDYWTCSFTGKAQARKKDGKFRVLTANAVAEEVIPGDDDEI